MLKNLFLEMPAIYWMAFAMMFGIAIFAINVAAKVMARFCFEEDRDVRWKPSREDLKNKSYSEKLTMAMSFGIIGVMIMHLTLNCHVWSLPFGDMLLMLICAFVPIIVILFLLIKIITKIVFDKYMKENFKLKK